MSERTADPIGRRLPDPLAAYWARDIVKVFGTLGVVYALYLFVGFLLGYDLFGQLNSLRRLTFLIVVYGIAALVVNLHWGYAGLFNIGVVGFMAIGVYTATILSRPVAGQNPTGSLPGFGVPLALAVVAGVLAAAAAGYVAALPSLRLRDDYFAIVTVGFSEIIRYTLLADTFSGTVTDPASSQYNVVNVAGLEFGTGGGRGIATPLGTPLEFLFEGQLAVIGNTLKAGGEAVGILPQVVETMTYTAVILLLVVTSYYVLARRIGNSPFGRVLKAIREDETAAQSLGKDTRVFKIKVFMLGSALMGLAGILWQGTYGFVNPNTFKPLVTFYVFTALIVGGPGSNTGSVVGGAVFASLLLQGPRRIAGLANALAEFLTGGGLPAPENSWVAFSSLDPTLWLGYIIAQMPNLKFMFLGAVLVYLMQNRSEGLLGHRKESASSVDLSERPQKPDSESSGGRPTVDGGETRE